MITLHQKENHWKTYYLQAEDFNKLMDYYNQSVPFKGTSGKYAISSAIVYPRYKIKASFETYNRTAVNKRSIAKNESYANYVVLPVTQMLKVLRDYRPEGDLIYYRYINLSELSTLKYLIKHFNSDYSSKPIIDFNDFSSNLEAMQERLTIPKAQLIVDLLNGDTASKKLGMEMLTNYDTARSIPAIAYVLLKAPNLKYQDYFTSTAFKSFRGRVSAYTKYSCEFFNTASTETFYSTLVGLLNGEEYVFTITEGEYDAIRQVMYEKIKQDAENKDIVLNITPEQVILNFPKEKIVSDDSVAEQDQILQEAILEDTESSYFLLDDTIEHL